ncbi:MAG: radical SAM protein [Thermodesulfobacteriota bacterium]
MTESPPYIISWNITRRCALKCPHCYMDSLAMTGGAEAGASRALAIVDEIAEFSPGAILILTGGEPLLRPDIFTIIRVATKRGLTVFLGTSGAELDELMVQRLKKAGTLGVGVSLDSATPLYHDRFRGLSGEWAKTIRGMELLKAAGIEFQIHFTVTEENKSELESMIELSLKSGAKALNIFFTVCTGRAATETDEETSLKPESYETILTEIARRTGGLEERLKLRARCAPQFMRHLAAIDPESPLLMGNTCGCIAGSSYMRITPLGEITPCPYIPAETGAPHIGAGGKTLQEIWEKEKTFMGLRGQGLRGRCGLCSYKDICGGCRARAIAEKGELLASDPSCTYEAVNNAVSAKKDKSIQWTKDAEARLLQVPRFLRPMVSKGLERYARHMGITEITPEIMARLRGKTGRT